MLWRIAAQAVARCEMIRALRCRGPIAAVGTLVAGRPGHDVSPEDNPMARNGSQVSVRSRSDERPAPPAAPPRPQTKPPSTEAIAKRAYAKFLARNGA